MHAAVAILQKILCSVSEYVDERNLRNVLLAAQALVSGRRLVLIELARHWPGAERVLGPLKRLDRLLGNDAVHQVRERFYQISAAWLLRCEQPVLVVDWSELKRDGRWALLRAGAVMRGRTMTVYEEVHPRRKYGNSKIHKAFLKRLQALLPESVRPLVITDAGFKNPWFQAVQALGWHWIGRVRHRTTLQRRGSAEKGKWVKCKTLYALASHKACCLGEVLLARNNPLRCRAVLVRGKPRGRVHLTRFGKRAQSKSSRKMAKGVREPWLLAASSSLNECSASALVAFYAKRMQIEQSFRDLKSHRYGCAFDDTLTRSAQRLEMLLLIHMLAALAAWLVGLAAGARAQARVCTPSLLKRYSALWIGWAYLRHAMSSPGALAVPRLLAPATSSDAVEHLLLAHYA